MALYGLVFIFKVELSVCFLKSSEKVLLLKLSTGGKRQSFGLFRPSLPWLAFAPAFSAVGFQGLRAGLSRVDCGPSDLRCAGRVECTAGFRDRTEQRVYNTSVLCTDCMATW